MKQLLITLLYFALLVSLPQRGNSQNRADSVGKKLNVIDFGISTESSDDQTDLIQRVLDQAAPGDTVFLPEGTYLVRTLLLRSDVNLLSVGLIKHHPTAKTGEYSVEKQNSPNPLILGKGIRNVNLSVKGESKNEGIYLLKSRQIRIANTELTGDSTKFRAYPGIMAFECSGIEIVNSRIHHFGKPREETHSYQPGTGIRILSSNTVSIHDSEIFNNGENGVFIHGSRKVDVLNNVIHHNGMSAIQVAFGDKGKERDYNFSHNILDSNAADAVDINNRSPKQAMDINCLIVENISCDNGFVKGEPTPDGSGIGTLINISNVILYKNKAFRNNRPAVYVESCGLILIKENWADNQVEVVLNLEELLIANSRFSSVDLMSNVKADKIQLRNNAFGSLSLPDKIGVKDFLITENSFSNARFNIHMSGKIHFLDNKIYNNSESPAFLIVEADKAIVEKNVIESKHASAIVLKNTAASVEILANRINSFNTAIFDDSSEGLLIKANYIVSLGGGKKTHTFRSHYPRNLRLENNEHVGIKGQPTVVFVGTGKASISGQTLTSGTASYGKVDVSEN